MHSILLRLGFTMTTQIRRRRRRNRIPSLLGALVLLTVATVGMASAAQLIVSSPDISTFSAAPCTYDTLSVRVSPAGFGASRSAIQVSGIPAECFGNTFQVGVSDTAGTLLASGSATCSAATCTIPTDTYNAPSVTDTHALAATWGIPSNWASACYYIIFFWYCT